MLLVMPLACLQVGNLQASKPGNCWNDAGDASGMPAGWQPAGIKQSLGIAGTMWVMRPACLQVGNCRHQSLADNASDASGVPAGWQPAGIKAWELLEGGMPAGWQPAGIKAWELLDDASDASGMPAGWQPAGIKAWKLLE